MNSTIERNETGKRGSSTADALQAAGDAASADDIRALDAAAEAADEKLAPVRSSLVERLIYGPAPSVEELRSGGRLALALEKRDEPIVDAALACLAMGEAFTADGKLAESLRRAVAQEGAYGYTVPAEFGGRGASYPELARVEELLAANGLGPLAVEISGELTIGAGSVLGYGTDEQKRTFLPMMVEGRLMGFALTEVGVGVNAKKIRAYVEVQPDGSYRLFAEGECNKLWITNAKHGAILGLAARIGRDGRQIGLFVLQLPAADVFDAVDGFEFRCTPSGVAAFTANHNARLHFKNFPLPAESRIPADGVAVLFYCLRMGRCMLAAMSAGYQRMLARDASFYAIRRIGVGGPVIKHELPRLALGKMLGGMLQSRALAYLSLKQDADGVDLAGLRDLTKSAAASTGLESMIACEHVLGGRSFDSASRVNAARVNLHLFGVVEGEDDMIRMGMVRDVTRSFVDRHLAALLDVLASMNSSAGDTDGRRSEPVLRLTASTIAKSPRQSAAAIAKLFRARTFWGLIGWIVRNAAIGAVRVPERLLPSGLLPRYRDLPPGLRRYARFAERKLRGLRWTYLALSSLFQLELTRAQIPLQRFGLCVEYLVSMLVLCHHASFQDESQQAVAKLQAQLLKDKFDSIKLLGSWRELRLTRDYVAAVGSAIERDECSLLRGLAAERYAHPWDETLDDSQEA